MTISFASHTLFSENLFLCLYKKKKKILLLDDWIKCRNDEALANQTYSSSTQKARIRINSSPSASWTIISSKIGAGALTMARLWMYNIHSIKKKRSKIRIEQVFREDNYVLWDENIWAPQKFPVLSFRPLCVPSILLGWRFCENCILSNISPFTTNWSKLIFPWQSNNPWKCDQWK